LLKLPGSGQAKHTEPGLKHHAMGTIPFKLHKIRRNTTSKTELLTPDMENNPDRKVPKRNPSRESTFQRSGKKRRTLPPDRPSGGRNEVWGIAKTARVDSWDPKKERAQKVDNPHRPESGSKGVGRGIRFCRGEEEEKSQTKLGKPTNPSP